MAAARGGLALLLMVHSFDAVMSAASVLVFAWIYVFSIVGRRQRALFREAAAMEERERLAREVHDLLADTLTRSRSSWRERAWCLPARMATPRAQCHRARPAPGSGGIE